MALAFQVLFVATALSVRICHAEVTNGAEKELSAEIESLRKIMGALFRLVMLQHVFVEERIRFDGDSGVKQVCHDSEGTRAYFSDTHGNSIKLFAIHEHANNVRTVSMGEFIGVLNGVEFRTRHNDVRLYMANRTSKQYHATEPIHFPDVSPEVLAKGTIDKQIAEMREWF